MRPIDRGDYWGGIVWLVLVLSGCANTSTGQAWEQSLAPDPQLQASPSLQATPIVSVASPSPLSDLPQLPTDFPGGIPLVEGAVLQQVQRRNGGDRLQWFTRWRSRLNPQEIRQFYQAKLLENRWQLVGGVSGEWPTSLVARRDRLEVVVAIATLADANPETEFSLTIRTIVPLTIGATPVASLPGTLPIVPSPAAPSPVGTSPSLPPDVGNLPAPLQSLVRDVLALGVIELGSESVKANTLLEPGKPVTRREYARWLLAVNNRLYARFPARQIRPALATATPVFQDLLASDRDFGSIQGLAEAGIIPSSLGGEGGAVNFAPDAPLTREQLLLWKVPLDIRGRLPVANLELLQQTWGFQDAPSIDPKASRAVLADFQNGDLSNIRRAFGFTTLFQPKKPVSRAEALATLWYFGLSGEGVSAQDALQP